MISQFLEYMQRDSKAFVERLSNCPLEDLYLITPEYLVPYLRYIKDHKRLFATVLKHASVLQLDALYLRLFRYVFTPILERCAVPEKQRSYRMQFYIHGLMAVINQWLGEDCAIPIEDVISVMQACIASSARKNGSGFAAPPVETTAISWKSPSRLPSPKERDK